MKIMERNMDCRNIRREIEEADCTEAVSASVSDHLTRCSRCETFHAEQAKLRQIVSNLGTVSAPGDFEFRLRARLASEKRGAAQPFRLAGVSFGLKSAALATMLLMIGSAALILSLRPGATDSSVAGIPGGAPKIDSRQPNGVAPTAPTVSNNGDASAPTVAVSTPGSGDRNATGPRGANRDGRAGNQLASAGSSRIKTRDMASTAAKIVRPEDLVAAAGHSVFPIDASTQPVRVSLDNGRGAAKTISVPGVSFGSQRTLNQNPSPLLASSRGAW